MHSACYKAGVLLPKSSCATQSFSFTVAFNVELFQNRIWEGVNGPWWKYENEHFSSHIGVL